MRALVVGAVLVAGASLADGKPLRTVSFEPGSGLCAIEDSGAIRCTEPEKLPANVKPRDIAHAYDLWVVDEHGKLFAWSPYPGELQPIAVPFAVREVEHVGSKLCAFGELGELACGKPDQKKLEVVAGSTKTKFRSIAFDDDAAWLIDDHDALWCLGGRNCARLYRASKHVAANTPLRDPAWGKAYPNELETGELPDAPLWRVADSVKRVLPTGDVCIERTKEPGTLTCWGFGNGPYVSPLPKADELVTFGAFLCARTKDTITCRWQRALKPDVYTFTIKNAVRMFVGGFELCVASADGGLACTQPKDGKLPALAPVIWATPRS
jgi:hypothetical protein